MPGLIKDYYPRFLANRLYSDILKSTSGRIISAALTFLKTILLVRLIAPDVYGAVAVLFSWSYVVSAIFEFGAGTAFISLESNGSPAEQSQRFGQLLRARMMIILIALGAVGLIATLYPAVNVVRALAALVLGMGQTICHSPEFYLQTQKKFKRFSQYMITISAIQLVWTAWAVWLYRQQLCSETVLLFLLSLSVWIAALPLFILARKKFSPGEIDYKNNFNYFLKILKFGKWVALTGILAYVYQRWAVILLGGYGRPTDAAAYDVALNFSQILNLLTLAVVNVLSPRFASVSNFDFIKKSFLKVLKLGGPVVTIILILYYWSGAPVFIYLFGASYTPSIAPLNMLLPSFLFTLLTEPVVAYATFGLKRPDIVFSAALIKTVTFMLLGAWIMRTNGLMGLALVQSAARILEHIVLTFITIWKIKTSPNL